MFDYEATKKRIARYGSVIRVNTDLGTAVRVSRPAAIKLLETLQRREIVPAIEFGHIDGNRWLVTIRAQS
jgi:hypothetical protein